MMVIRFPIIMAIGNILPRLSQMYFPIFINRASPFTILVLMGGTFHILFKN